MSNLPRGSKIHVPDESDSWMFGHAADEGDVSGEMLTSEPRPCFHEWARYTGLNECFDYCVICPAKRDVPK